MAPDEIVSDRSGLNDRSGSDSSGPVDGAVTHLFFHPQARSLAEPLAAEFHVVERNAPPMGMEGFYLWAVDDRLELRRGAEPTGLWVPVSEVSRRAAEGRELLRACGAAQRPSVLDALAGWGIDGLVLARRGCEVLMVERHPAVAALQRDLARRSGVSGVQHRRGDGYLALTEGGRWDVIYLDPMFPGRRKGALPAKRMQWLAALTEPDSRPLTQWVETARGRAGGRVVLKRRRKDPVVLAPDWQIAGRTVRYDVYRGRAEPPS